ncbi:hypothetical protein AB0H51_11485 [Streptomyces griseoluteus]|uniref:hypothetical protein n=1 Tax=Streptomyces griseoluteus TaxID=29306 RepID=UPI0033F4C2F5
MTTAHAADQLDTITERWTTLADRAGDRPTTTWPPAMGITRLLSEQERQEQAAERLDTAPDAPGPRPAPVDVNILDVMTTIETGLLEAADAIAERVQRPGYRAQTGRGWTDEAHREIALLAMKDAADPRRWKLTGQRTAPDAAEWLAQRLRDQPGPFRPLNETERELVAAVAATAAELLQRTLGDARQRTDIPHPCPMPCGGQLVVEGGDGQPPVVLCEDCGRTWRETEAPGDAA